MRCGIGLLGYARVVHAWVVHVAIITQYKRVVPNIRSTDLMLNTITGAHSGVSWRSCFIFVTQGLDAAAYLQQRCM
jgi:hypothetical protein